MTWKYKELQFKANSVPAEARNQRPQWEPCTHSALSVGAPWRDMFPSLGRSQSPTGFGTLQSTFLWSIALLDGSSTSRFNPCNAKMGSKNLKISDLPRQFVYAVELLSDTGVRKSTHLQPCSSTTKNKPQTLRQQALLAGHGRFAMKAHKGILIFYNSVI